MIDAIAEDTSSWEGKVEEQTFTVKSYREAVVLILKSIILDVA